jgi:hypothetical protein
MEIWRDFGREKLDQRVKKMGTKWLGKPDSSGISAV